jgi:hypothetical protein
MQTQRNELQDQNRKLRQELDQLYSSVGARQVLCHASSSP